MGDSIALQTVAECLLARMPGQLALVHSMVQVCICDRNFVLMCIVDLEKHFIDNCHETFLCKTIHPFFNQSGNCIATLKTAARAALYAHRCRSRRHLPSVLSHLLAAAPEPRFDCGAHCLCWRLCQCGKRGGIDSGVAQCLFTARLEGISDRGGLVVVVVDGDQSAFSRRSCRADARKHARPKHAGVEPWLWIWVTRIFAGQFYVVLCL